MKTTATFVFKKIDDWSCKKKKEKKSSECLTKSNTFIMRKINVGSCSDDADDRKTRLKITKTFIFKEN